MCEVTVHSDHTHTPPNLGVLELAALRDPSRTTTLRNAFARAIVARFRRLRSTITQTIVRDDVFGLREPSVLQSPGRRAFAFPRSADKVAAFMEWLRREIDSEILQVAQAQQVGTAVEAAWSNRYIQDSYRRGVTLARAQLKQAGFDVPSLEATGGAATLMNTPLHLDRLGLLYTRTFNELRGITNAMDQRISRLLAQGIADGLNPNTLARMLNHSISGMGSTLGLPISYVNPRTGRLVEYFMPPEQRARILARTEIVRAHAEAQLQEFKNWGAENVIVKAEWVTAGDNRVCQQCADLQNSVFSLEQAQGMIPLHPGCRCAWVPYKEKMIGNN